MQNLRSSSSTFVIAEAGINHNGDLETAKELIREAANADADAVKFQFWNAEKFHSEPDQIKRLRSLEFGDEEWKVLKDVADENNITFFGSAFDKERVDFLIDELNVPVLKVASGDLTHIPLLEHISTKETPVIISTGMATLGEVDRAFQTLESNDAETYLLECVSSYPVDIEDLNLLSIETLYQNFDCGVGFSDHTLGTTAPVAAAALGATIIEKHFTLDTNMEGADHQLSLEPESFKRMVEKIRAVESGLGNKRKQPLDLEADSINSMRRGLKTTKQLSIGDRLTSDKIKIARPASGLEPRNYNLVLGREIENSLDKNDPITWDDLLGQTN